MFGRIANGASAGRKAFIAKAAIRDESGKIVKLGNNDLSARRFAGGGTPENPEEFMISFPAASDAATLNLSLEPWLSDDPPDVIAGPKIVPAPARRLVQPIRQRKQLLHITIAHTKSTLQKEFICRIVYRDERGDVILPPYPNLHTMERYPNGYFYLSGDLSQRRLKIERSILPPLGAQTIEVEIDRWAAGDQPICLDLEVREDDSHLSSPVSTAPSQEGAARKTTRPREDAQSITCRTFLHQDVLVLNRDMPADAPIGVGREGVHFELDTADIVDINIGIRILATSAGGSAHLDVAYRSGAGDPLGEERVVLDARRWWTTVAARITPPLGAEKAAIRISPLDDRPITVANGAGLALHRSGLSVIVGVYKAEDHIERLLRSFAAQTLSHDSFELIFVVNGEPDTSEDMIRAWMSRHHSLSVTIAHEEIASLGNARNAGTRLARFSHVTFVDCDDTISPGYLAGMFAVLGRDVIAVADVVDVTEDGAIMSDSQISMEIRPIRELDATPSLDVLRATSTLSACKAIPAFYNRTTSWTSELRSGEDVAYYCDIYTKFSPEFRLADGEMGSVYYRTLRSNSLSRRSASYQFSVLERLDVVDSLSAVRSRPMDPRRQAFVDAKIDAQSDFSSRFLHDHPEAFSDYLADVRSRNFSYFPEQRVRERSAARIVFAYCFPPSVDPSAVTAAKRLVEYGAPCDVVSNAMKHVRVSDARMRDLVSDWVGYHEELAVPPLFSNGNAVVDFAERAVATAERFADRRRAAYSSAYSRAMWPASHFAGALFKLRYPDTIWEAEFSDPILLDTRGLPRPGDLPPGWLKKKGFLDALRERGLTLDGAGEGVFFWCEVLPYVLADRVMFTNATQREFMLSYAPVPLRDAVRRKSEIRPHPIIPGWGQRWRRPYSTSNDCVNLAYFGTFYAQRGLGHVFEALCGLDRLERSRTRLFIFTKNVEETFAEVERAGLVDVVIVRRELPYVDFLTAMSDFDALIVNDVDDLSIGNPYLPSKLSDYASTNVPILALFQPGSELSRRPEPMFRCSLNDPDFSGSFRAILRQVLATKLERQAQPRTGAS